MKIKPNDNYELLGTDIKLDKNKVYDIEPVTDLGVLPYAYANFYATNQPDWETQGLIFVEEVLLSKNEYTVVKE